MQKIKDVFSSFSVDDVAKAKQFYTEVLGLNVEDGAMGLKLQMVGGGTVYIYPKDNHQPATFTVLNLEVEDIEAALDDLAKHNVVLEHYKDMGQDKKGVFRGRAAKQGPDIAWFKDPAGNIVSILQN
jgi:catechol 2,3-dioxygenase-like lactoylglutathione lyase family enzyme